MNFTMSTSKVNAVAKCWSVAMIKSTLTTTKNKASIRKVKSRAKSMKPNPNENKDKVTSKISPSRKRVN